MANTTLAETAVLLDAAKDIVDRFAKIADIVWRYENTEEFNSISAIEAVAKIMHGEVKL